MGIGVSLVLFALGAILTFAVNIADPTGGINIHTIGVILMVVAGIGMLLSLAFWSSWGGFSGAGRRSGTYVEGPRVATRTTTIDEV